MASSMEQCFFTILHIKNSVKTRLYYMKPSFFINPFLLSFQNRWLHLFSLETKVVLVKKKNIVEVYTSLFVLLSSFRSSHVLHHFSILQAPIRRDYLRRVLFKLINFLKFALVKKKKKKKKKKKTVEGYTSLFVLLSSK